MYPGARILGRVDIGARAQVGPNCVIYRSLEPGTTVLPPEPMVLEGLSFTLRFESDAERGDAPAETAGEETTEPESTPSEEVVAG